MYNSIKHLYGVYEKMERDFDIELSEIAVIKESSSDSIFNFKRNGRKWDGFIYFAEADGVFSFDGGEQYKIKNSCVFFLREGDRYSVKLNSGYRYITTAYRISNLTGTQLLKIPRMHIASGKEAAIIETANRLWKQKDAYGYFAAKVNLLSLYLEVIREKSSENQGESKLSLASLMNELSDIRDTLISVNATLSDSPSELNAKENISEVIDKITRRWT